ncbi:hypothetical protein OG242_12570 [Streptomyces sp. NBC_00727]
MGIADQFKDKAKDLAGQARNEDEPQSKGRDRAKNASQQGRDRAQDATRQGRDKAQDTADDMRERFDR